MVKEIIFIIKENDEGELEAQAVGHSIFTSANSFDELKLMIKEATACHFDPTDMPQLANLHFVKDEVMSL